MSTNSAVDSATVLAADGCDDRYGQLDEPHEVGGLAAGRHETGQTVVRYQRSELRSAGARPVVFLHGAGGSMANWIFNVRPLAQIGFDAITLDLPGFAGTRLPRAGEPLDGVVDALLDFLDDVVGAPAVLVGHSLGSFLAVKLAEASPDDVAGLLLVAYPTPSVVTPSRQSLDQRALLAFMRLVGLVSRTGLSPGCTLDIPVLNRVVWSGLVRSPGRLDLRALRLALAHFGEGPTGLALAVGGEHDVEALLQAVQVPTVLVHGAGDRLAPRGEARTVADRARKPIVIFPDCGHWLMLERPRCLNSMIRAMASSSYEPPGRS